MKKQIKLKLALLSLVFLSISSYIISCGQEVSFMGLKLTNNSEDATAKQEEELPSGIITTPPVEYDTEGLDEFTIITKKFNTTEYSQDNLTLSLTKPYTVSELNLAYNKVPSSQTITQEKREKLVSTFTQGSRGSFASEIKTTDPSKGALDLLIVMDNSNSMKEEQVNLGSKLKSLLTYIDDADWRIGVNTTDPANGCLRALIKKGDENIEEKFATAVNAGVMGTGYEKGILMARAGIAPNCIQPNWVRDNSTLAILIVSDEDNCSFNGYDCYGKAYAHENYLISYLNTIRKVGVDARIYGIIWHPTTPRAKCPTGNAQAHIYSRAIEQTKGKWGSICDDDYSETLKAISADVALILKKQYTLEQTPTHMGVKVFANNKEITSGFKIEGNSVIFDELEDDASLENLKFEYYYNDSPIISSFKLEHPAYHKDFEVFINDKLVDPSLYSWDKTTNSIVFNEAPEESAKILINYKEDKELNKKFNLSSSKMDWGSIEIYVNDKLVDPTQYIINKEDLSLNFVVAPEENDSIKIKYNDLDKKLNYEFLYDISILKGFKIVDKKTQEPVNYTYDGKTLKFEEDLFEEGRTLELSYENPVDDSGEVNLLHKIVDGSLEVKCHKDSCPLVDTELDGTKLKIKTGVKNDSDVDVSYKYISNRKKVFTIEEINKDDSYFWDIYLNDKPVDPSMYEIKEKSVIFKDYLPLDSVVSISVYKG